MSSQSSQQLLFAHERAETSSIAKTFRVHAGLEVQPNRRPHLWIEMRDELGLLHCSEVTLEKPALQQLDDERFRQWESLLARFEAAQSAGLQQRYQWTREIYELAHSCELESPHSMPEWKIHCRRIKETFGPGMYAFYIELSQEELDLIDSLSDAKIGRF
jgi:hypothetical protein